MHFYVTNVMVNPAHQRRGIGTQVVEALVTAVKRVQYANILVEALPLPGLEHFYAKLGFKAPKVYAPGMHLWLNGTRTP